MEFDLVAPYAWQAVLKERGNVASSPNDGEAWGQLAKAYKAIFFLEKGYRPDAGGEEIYKSSVEAYEKCLTLLPNDAEWHAGFAELLANRLYWDHLGVGATADTYRAFHEIQTALQLAPTDAKVQNIAQEISSMFPDSMIQNGTSYDFIWLTQTPTPYPTDATTATLEPKQTLITSSTDNSHFCFYSQLILETALTFLWICHVSTTGNCFLGSAKAQAVIDRRTI